MLAQRLRTVVRPVKHKGSVLLSTVVRRPRKNVNISPNKVIVHSPEKVLEESDPRHALLAVQTSRHKPVLLSEVVTALMPQDGGVFIDATFGAGGHSREILRRLATAPAGRLYCVDRDKTSLEANAELFKQFEGKAVPVHSRFGNMIKSLGKLGLSPGSVDGILMDIGVSSMQIDQPHRGFSYRPALEGPLDMRMNQNAKIPTAADLCNSLSARDLAKILREYGEETRAHAAKIADAIVAARETQPLTKTTDLIGICAAIKPRERPETASKLTFQALRIAVNNELEELRDGLKAAEVLLKPGGKLAVITFHSLETRLCKNFLVECSRKNYKESKVNDVKPSFEEVSKAIKASQAELDENSRASSAILRVATRTRNPPIAPTVSYL